jgi:hypothetical protein
MSAGLSIDLERASFEPGARLAGSVTWSAGEPIRGIGLTLLWYTAGKGDEDVVVVSKTSLDASGAAGRQSFELALPDFPWSFSGELVSLVWAVEAAVDGTLDRAVFTMAPGGSEVKL